MKKFSVFGSEVILSAGAFNSPQLLKLSGVGPRAELERFGLPVVVDLPGVGENLQDRYEVGIIGEVDSNFSSIDDCFGNLNRRLRDWEQGKGPMQTNGTVTSILKRSNPSMSEADLHIFGVPGTFAGYYPGYAADSVSVHNRFPWVLLKAHTENRAGSVELRSKNPRDWPEINFRYFDDGDTWDGQDERDLAAVVDGIEFIRDIQKTSDSALLFSDYSEIWPGPEVATRKELGDWGKAEAWGHHASCSNKIGSNDDPMAVLDFHFRVRGTTGLRVVDASVFPVIPGTFIVLPTPMISERAADVILGE